MHMIAAGKFLERFCRSGKETCGKIVHIHTVIQDQINGNGTIDFMHDRNI